MIKILVIGLGNPGYAYTRHNAGADYLNVLLQKYEHRKVDKNLYIVNIKGIYVMFYICPSSMNISGQEINRVYQYYKCTNLIVCVDELDLKVGQYKVIKLPAAKGHNGIRSVMQYFKDFIIIRIGISRPQDQKISDYVLKKFSDQELQILMSLYQDIDIYKIIEENINLK